MTAVIFVSSSSNGGSCCISSVKIRVFRQNSPQIRPDFGRSVFARANSGGRSPNSRSESSKMAETVRKSRIVSDNSEDGNRDDNLEDALMEEFNMRLKSCMSQDDLNNPEEPHYEDIEDVATSCHGFLQSERDNHYDSPSALLTTCLVDNAVVNVSLTSPPNLNVGGDHSDDDELEETNYVDMTSPSSFVATDNDDNDDEQLLSSPLSQTSSVKNRMLLSTDNADTACLLFTQTVTSPMLTPSEETVDFLKGFATTTTCTTNVEHETNEENFYENTEFLSQNHEVIYENVRNPQPPENIYENVRNIGGGGDDVIYENLPTDKQAIAMETVEPIVVDDSEETEQQQPEEKQMSTSLIENYEDVMETVEPIVVVDSKETEHQQSEGKQMSTSIIKTYEDVAMATATKCHENLERDTESVPAQIVHNLKCQFMAGEEGGATVRRDLDDVANLKSVDILKQINKFENESSQMVTVETSTTMTYESGSSVVGGGVVVVEGDTIDNNNRVALVKKKRTKKSRKEEKENISVNGNADATTNNTNNNYNNKSEEFFYDVNVKNLCRSFGDLTRIMIEDHNNSNNNRMKSSFNKFDALQKKNVLHVRSSDSSKAQEKFSGQVDSSATATNCRACDKAVFQMEQVKAEKAIWHKNCFRCHECNKQLTVDTYQSHEATLYCKPHFKALFAPKVIEDEAPPKPRKPELIIRENQPAELPPDVVRASDKPDLGLEELSSLNVKQRFQVFEHHQQQSGETNELMTAVNVKRSPSILSKLARFQAKGMDVGIHDDALNGIPIEESSSEDGAGDDSDEGEGGATDGEDADLVRARKCQKEKPFHFTGMTDVKNRWEQGEQTNSRDERREERKQEIQSIRNRLFMGKQGKMKEAYQQAVMVSESCTNLHKEPIEVTDTKTIKEKFESGQVQQFDNQRQNSTNGGDDIEVYESEISKNSRSLFLELDANASKQPQAVTPSPLATTKSLSDVKKAREAYMARTTSTTSSNGQDVVKSSVENVVDDVEVRTADIQQRFKFFETYKEPEKEKRQFRITPPRDGQVKAPTPEREVYRDPEVIRNEDAAYVEDSVIAKETHTATKMLNKFRQMEEELANQSSVTMATGPKPLKCFTPPPEPTRAPQPNSSEEDSGESGESEDEDDVTDRAKYVDGDLIEAQKAARAKQLRAKFEKWEANEIKREQNNSAVNIAEELGDEQSQIESTRTLRARFESMRDSDSRAPRQIKVNRFVEIQSAVETCDSCRSKVYPLEKIKVHGRIYHRHCFKCMECNCILRMDSYSYNQGLLYCTPHFKRLFISKGNYDTAFGLDQHKEKWNSVTMA